MATSHSLSRNSNDSMLVGLKEAEAHSEKAIISSIGGHPLQRSKSLALLSNRTIRVPRPQISLSSITAKLAHQSTTDDAESQESSMNLSKLVPGHLQKRLTLTSTQILGSGTSSTLHTAEAVTPTVGPQKTVTFDETVQVQGPDHGYRAALDLFMPVSRTPAVNNDRGLDYRRYHSPIEQLGSCTTWRGVSARDAKVIFDIHGVFLPYVERLVQTQLRNLITPAQLESSTLDFSPWECKAVPISLSLLANGMLATLEKQHRASGFPVPEHLMEFIFLYFISSNCFITLETYDGTDEIVHMSVKIEVAQPMSLPKAVILEQLDHLSFTELNVLPQEGEELLIIPHYRRGPQTIIDSTYTTVSYNLGSSIPWLSWDNRLYGFRGIVPKFSEGRDPHEYEDVVNLGREEPYATIHLLRIEICAILHEYHSTSSVHIKRMIRTRLNLKVTPWYDFPSGVPHDDPYSGRGYDQIPYQVSDNKYPASPILTVSSLNYDPEERKAFTDSSTVLLPGATIPEQPSNARPERRNFNSSDYDVNKIVLESRKDHTSDILPATPRMLIDDHFELDTSSSNQHMHHSEVDKRLVTIDEEKESHTSRSLSASEEDWGIGESEELSQGDLSFAGSVYFEEPESSEHLTNVEETRLKTVAQLSPSSLSSPPNEVPALPSKPGDRHPPHQSQRASPRKSSIVTIAHQDQEADTTALATSPSPGLQAIAAHESPPVRHSPDLTSSQPGLVPLDNSKLDPRSYIMLCFNRYAPLRNLRQWSLSLRSSSGNSESSHSRTSSSATSTTDTRHKFERKFSPDLLPPRRDSIYYIESEILYDTVGEKEDSPSYGDDAAEERTVSGPGPFFSDTTEELLPHEYSDKSSEFHSGRSSTLLALDESDNIPLPGADQALHFSPGIPPPPPPPLTHQSSSHSNVIPNRQTSTSPLTIPPPPYDSNDNDELVSSNPSAASWATTRIKSSGKIGVATQHEQQQALLWDSLTDGNQSNDDDDEDKVAKDDDARWVSRLQELEKKKDGLEMWEEMKREKRENERRKREEDSYLLGLGLESGYGYDDDGSGSGSDMEFEEEEEEGGMDGGERELGGGVSV